MQILKADKGKNILGFVYFHGRLANKLSTDLVEGDKFPPCGVSEVQVEGISDRCLAFIWTRANGRNFCGLITMVKDRKSTLDAYQKYFSRKQHL